MITPSNRVVKHFLIYYYNIKGGVTYVNSFLQNLYLLIGNGMRGMNYRLIVQKSPARVSMYLKGMVK
jgi:hypothetical protein